MSHILSLTSPLNPLPLTTHTHSHRLLGRQSKINLKYDSYNSSSSTHTHTHSGNSSNASQNLYFIGHSMGGAVATMAGVALTQLGMASNSGSSNSTNSSGSNSWASAYAQKHALTLAGIGKSFKGTILLSPLIEINAPKAAQPLFHLITQCCPGATLPQMLASRCVYFVCVSLLASVYVCMCISSTASL